MTDTPPQGNGLEILRRELDELDDGILALLVRRFAVTERVRGLKKDAGSGHHSPLRPAREAQILKRLLELCQGTALPPELVVRLWRGILTQSSLTQAPMTLHIPRRINQVTGERMRLRDHFSSMPVEEARDEAQAMVQVQVTPGDICVVEPNSPWVEPFLGGKAGSAQVIGTLPVLSDNDAPRLLIIGNAPQETSGNDETLLLSNGSLPRDFSLQPLWQAKSGAHRVTALAGFFSEHEGPLVGLLRSNPALGLKIAGRYPSAFEV